MRRLQDKPVILEWIYALTMGLLRRMRPLLKRIGYERLEGTFETVERVSKQAVFGCKMCGQCTLHTTGMTCPMTCPKNLRNGPCGGVRHDGTCEIKPDMPCVWLQAWERTEQMTIYPDDIMLIQPPLDRQQEGQSAFLNALDEERGMNGAWREIVNHG